MKANRTSLALLAAVFLGAASLARAAVSVGVSLSDGGLDSFYLNVSDYYHVPQPAVLQLRDRHVPDEEIPVVLFLAAQAHVGPEIIVEARLAGRPWMEIAREHHVDAGAFYVPLDRDPGPPYGHAYGYYKKFKRNQWRKINLADADVVNFVNLRFASEHYGYSPDEVVRFRGQGGKFHQIGKRGEGHGAEGREHGRGRGRGKGHDSDDDDGGEGRGHGHGHGKGHDKD